MFAFDFRERSWNTWCYKDEGSVTNMGSLPSNGDICGIALDLSAGKMYATSKANSTLQFNEILDTSGNWSCRLQVFLQNRALSNADVSVDAGGGGNEYILFDLI